MNFNNENAYRAYPFVSSLAPPTLDGRPWPDFDAAIVGFGAFAVGQLAGLGLDTVENTGETVTYGFSNGSTSVSVPVPVGFRGTIKFNSGAVSGHLCVWDQSVLPIGAFTLSRRLELEPALLVSIGSLFLRQVLFENEDEEGAVSIAGSASDAINFIDGYNSVVFAAPATNTVTITARVGAGLGIPGDDGTCKCEEAEQCSGAIFSIGGANADSSGAVRLTPGTGIAVQTSPATHGINIRCTAVNNFGCQ